MTITQKILKNLVIGGLFLVPFIAFIVPGMMFFPFITGKGFTFRILVEIIFGLYATLAFTSPEYRLKFSWLTKSVLFFTLAILVSDLLGANIYKSLWSNYERMEGFVLIVHLLMYYIVISSVFKNISHWNQFFNTSIIASIIMSCYSILQLLGVVAINQGGVRVDATFGNASYLAIYLVFHIFLCLYMFVNSQEKFWQKWAYLLGAIFETVILYFTATRGAILGLIGGLIITGLLIVWKEKENLKLRKMAYGLLAGIFLFLVLFLALRNTAFVKNSPVLSRFSNLGTAELKTQGRYFVWPMAVKGVLERPLFGWGQENFNFVFNKYYDPRMYAQEQWFDRTHDIFLDWLIAGGAVGFLAYASMYIALFYYIWRRQSMLKISEKSILTGMILAYIFHNTFVFDNLISYILFFSILAYIHTKSIAGKEYLGRFHTKVFSSEVIYYIITPIAVIFIIGAVYFVNVPALLANQTLIKAISPQTAGGVEKNLALFKKVYDYNSLGSTEATEQLVQVTMQIFSSQLPDTVKKEFYDFAKLKIEEKVLQTPNDARYLVFAGGFLNRFGQYDLAIKYLERALKESPKKQPIYFELGTSYLGKKDFGKMSELFKTAYDLERNSLEGKIIYTIGALYSRDPEVLKEMSTQISQDVIISDNRFLNAYAEIGDYNSVIAILNARIEKDPTNGQYKLSLASAYATIGQKQKAIDIISDMIAKDPSFKTQGEEYIKQIQNS